MDHSPQGIGKSKSTISETRRAQIRQAQKSYHARKRLNFESLESRASFLEETTQQMVDVLLDLNDKLLDSAHFQNNPRLVGQLQSALQQTISIASRAIPDNDDDATTFTESGSSTTQPPSSTYTPSSTGSMLEEDPKRAPHSRPLSVEEYSPNLPPLTLTLNPLHESDVLTRHPLAPVVFPPTNQWSEFCRRLRWGSIKLSFVSLLGVEGRMLPLAHSIFQLALRWYKREAILENFCCLLEYQSGGPVMEDGTMILKPRPICMKKKRSQSNGQANAKKAGVLIHQFLQDCWLLHERTCEDLVSSGANVSEYLEPLEVEQYLQVKGLRFRTDGYVELPSSSTSYSTFGGQNFLDQGEAAAHQRSMEGEEIVEPMHQDLYDPTWDLHPRFQASKRTARRVVMNPEKVLWLEPRVLFPEGSESIEEESFPSPQSSYSSSSGVNRRRLISYDQIIDILNRQSIYIGSGGRIPTLGIDSTIESLATMNAL